VQHLGRQALIKHFRWQGGHADLWRVWADPDALAAVIAGLVEPWQQERVTKVVGIESRGFLLGGAAALSLGAGFVGVRKATGPLPGSKVTATADADYRGMRHQLRMQRVLKAHDRVLLVDDWAERGSQARGARALVESEASTFLGCALLVDQLVADSRAALGRVTALAYAHELGDPSEGE
jgi:adenine phosphoribosyltransferase